MIVAYNKKIKASKENQRTVFSVVNKVKLITGYAISSRFLHVHGAYI